jgi:hypothetical protein
MYLTDLGGSMLGTKRHWLAPLVVLSAGVLMLAGVPAGAASPTPPPAPKVNVSNLKVLDGDGNPFPGEAGVVYCVGTDPCQASMTDHDGNVNPFFVNPNVQYHVFAFATDTGWSCGGYPFLDKLWWFGTGTDAAGRTLARPATFVMAQPECPLEFHVLNADDNDQPFALGHAGMWACPVVNCVTADGPDKNIVFAGADAEGDVFMSGLDPAVEYRFVFYAVDVDGWSCPSFSYQGHDYWQEPEVDGVPSAVDGHTAYISDNVC